MNRQTILNLDGKPFEKMETAEYMRDLLNQESARFQTGCRYRIDETVDDNNLAQYVVVRADNAQQPLLTSDDVDNKPGATTVYHPALRVYVFSLPWFLASTAMYLFAQQLWVFVLTAMGVTRLPAWIDASLLIDATGWIGLLWLTWLVIGVLLAYYGTTLTVDERGITYRRGILVRDMTHVRFNEIRRVGLRQGLLDRLLNTGILEFVSSGTDDVDIRFIGIANPARVRAAIEERVELKA